MAFAVIFLAVGIVIAWMTYAYALVSFEIVFLDLFFSDFFKCFDFQNHTGIFLAYVGMFLVAGLLLARTFYYRRMKVSVIEGPI